MVKRSTPQKEIDQRAFPVQVFLRVPPGGMGAEYAAMHAWLRGHLDPADYALHSGGTASFMDRTVLMLRDPGVAVALLAAVPALELADGTVLRGYTSTSLPRGRVEDEAVCNLYSMTRTQEAMRQIFAGQAFRDLTGNLEPGSVYPNGMAPIVRHDGDGLALAMARWGMPSPPAVLTTTRDPGVTNLRNLGSPHWRRWLGPAHRALIPFTSFAEPRPGGNQWFAPEGPAFFAGVQVQGWRSVRKVKDGETVDDLFGFLTCAPNAEVAVLHPKAMPVILTTPAEWEAWMTGPFEAAAALQRPLPDGALTLIDAPV